MTGNRINKFIVGMLLMALVGGLLPGASALASGGALAAQSQCMCSSSADCLSTQLGTQSLCMNMPVSSGCRCSISSAPDPEETPAIVQVVTRPYGVDGTAATLPVQAELVDNSEHTWVVTPVQIIYDFLYSSSCDGRAPPFATHII